MHDSVHACPRLLIFCCQGIHYGLHLHGVCFEDLCGCFHPPICVEVDVVGECGKFPIHHLNQVLHSFSEELLHD